MSRMTVRVVGNGVLAVNKSSVMGPSIAAIAGMASKHIAVFATVLTCKRIAKHILTR